MWCLEMAGTELLGRGGLVGTAFGGSQRSCSSAVCHEPAVSIGQ